MESNRHAPRREKKPVVIDRRHSNTYSEIELEVHLNRLTELESVTRLTYTGQAELDR